MPDRARKVFTDSFISSLRPAAGQQSWREIADWGCRGLHLKLSPRGEKVWGVRHVIGGRRRRHIIGAYPAISLAEARKRAGQYIAAGRDGMTAVETDARLLGQEMSVLKAHERYIADVGKSLRSSTVYLKKGLYRRHIGPAIGSRLIRTIRKVDIVETISAIRRHSPVQANRVLAEVMAMLRWCEESGFIDGIPSIRKRTIATRETPRRRVLSDAEVVTVWKASGQIGDQTRDFIRLLLLTGQRRDEVRNMAWDEIDLAKAVWVIPASRYKTGIDHLVPLSEAVCDILRAHWREGATGFVLANPRTEDAYNGAASAMRRLRRKVGGLAHFTLHDLRRTVRTGMARLGIDEQTAEMVLGHAIEGMRKVYDLHDRLGERRRALAVWGTHLSNLGPVYSYRVRRKAATRLMKAAKQVSVFS